MYPEIMNDIESSNTFKEKLEGYVEFGIRRGGGMVIS